MTRILICAIIVIAASLIEPRHGVGAAKPASTARARDSHAKPQPGELKTFGDWTVGCDNTRRCELRSLVTGPYEPGSVTVAIARDAGPTGRVSFTAGTNGADAVSAQVEGAGPARSPAALVAAMANGRWMIVRVAGRGLPVSLVGASAALRYTDAVQGRAGTVTALVAKGPKPASGVPAASAAPTIVAVVPGGKAGTATADQLAAIRRLARCDTTTSDAPGLHALGQGRTLVLLPCSSGAYNVLETLFVLDGTGFRAAGADAPVGFDATGADGPRIPTVVNGEWKDGVLTSYAKGRGLGDCGVDQEFVWDGTGLRLSRQRAMGECRGNADFITTWRAQVVRR